MNISSNFEDVRLIRNDAQNTPIIISDMSKPQAQALATSLRMQGHVVMSYAEAAEAGTFPNR